MATPTAEKLEWYWAAKYLSADNDPLTLFATEAGSDRKNLVDSSLTQADDFFNGGIVRMVGGQNPGVYKRVRDFDQATNKITLDSDLPVLPDVSDQFQLIIGGNFRSSSQVDGLTFSGLTMGGITIDRVGYLNGPGAGTLTFTQASSELSWTAPGGVAGTPVDISLDGTYTLFSTDQNKWISVSIVAASLDTSIFKFGSGALELDEASSVSVPSHSSFHFEDRDFTIELFARFASLTVQACPVFFGQYNDIEAGPRQYYFGWNSTAGGVIQFRYSTTGAAATAVDFANFTPTLNRWYHIAICRRGPNLECFIDGIKLGATFNIGSDVLFSPNEPLTIGARSSTLIGDDCEFNGHLDAIRISNGTARYTNDFIAPNTEFPKGWVIDKYTALLLEFEGSAGDQSTADGSGNEHVASFVGAAEIDTADSRVGSSSLELFTPGSDYLEFPASPNFVLGTDNFCFEAWVKFDAIAGNVCLVSSVNNTAGSFLFQYESGTSEWVLVENAQQFRWSDSGLVTGRWYHIAVAKIFLKLRVWRDGRQLFPDRNSTGTFYDFDGGLRIGADYSLANGINGSIDQVRLWNGAPPYSADFTPPNKPHPIEHRWRFNDPVSTHSVF